MPRAIAAVASASARGAGHVGPSPVAGEGERRSGAWTWSWGWAVGSSSQSAAAVNDDRLHADGFHKDEIGHEVIDSDIVFHKTAAKLDDGRLSAMLADPFHCFNENVGFCCRHFNHSS